MYIARCEHCLTALGSHSAVERKAAICRCFVLPKSGANCHRYAFVINVHKVLYTLTIKEVMASHAHYLDICFVIRFRIISLHVIFWLYYFTEKNK